MGDLQAFIRRDAAKIREVRKWERHADCHERFLERKLIAKSKRRHCDGEIRRTERVDVALKRLR